MPGRRFGRRRRPPPSRPSARDDGGGVKRGLDVAWGIGIALFGAMFGTIALVEMLTGGDGKTATGSYIGLIALFAFVIFWGVRLIWRAARQPPTSPTDLAVSPTSPSDPESRVRAHARSAGGRVTVVEVAAHCGLSLDEAKRVLDRLAAEQVAALRVTEDGILVYHFPADIE